LLFSSACTGRCPGEVKARQGPIIAITTEGNTELAKKINDIIYIPETVGPLTPLLSAVPLQLRAYHIAVMRGCDVDKPRNLAKNVTVERSRGHNAARKSQNRASRIFL